VVPTYEPREQEAVTVAANSEALAQALTAKATSAAGRKTAKARTTVSEAQAAVAQTSVMEPVAAWVRFHSARVASSAMLVDTAQERRVLRTCRENPMAAVPIRIRSAAKAAKTRASAAVRIV
jgi:hypothetical protein